MNMFSTRKFYELIKFFVFVFVFALFLFVLCLDFQGTAAIKVIFLDMSKIREFDLNLAAFSKMYNLRVLKFYNSEPSYIGKCKVCLPPDLKSLPDALRYLYWDGYPSKSLPQNFDPHNLVELEMPNSQVERLWHQVQVYMPKPCCTFHISCYFFVLWKKFIFLFNCCYRILKT